MDVVALAAFGSWRLDPRVIVLLAVIAAVYVRGWLHGRRLLRHHNDTARLASFLCGLLLVFLASESPLDAFDSLFLSAHMVQHLLLMMLAPLLLLLGHPVLPMLRGLPKWFVKDGLGPFLTWPALRRCLSWLTSPPVAWLVYAVSTLAWHVPYLYELALRNPGWHSVQHASFFWTGILFWWPVIEPGPGKSHWPLWIKIPYLASSDLINTALSAFLIFSGKLLYPTYAAVRLTGLTADQDQVLAGAIMWVPGSVLYLIPAVGYTMQLLSPPKRSRVLGVPVRPAGKGRSRWQPWRIRRFAQAAMLLVSIAVVADGFHGPQVAPINMAGVLPWIHWRGLSMIALLLVGNLFCFACPFTFVRDLGRKVLPANLRWPRSLRSKWLPVALLAIYIWAYEAYSLWDKPWITAWIIVAYFLAASIIDGLFRGASFCKYVCPIGQFHFVSSLVSPREVSIRSTSTCNSCKTFDCIKGNEAARGCELNLFQPRKSGNLDCTFCLDCVKACPHDNVTLVSIQPASTLTIDPYRSSVGRLSKRWDWAVLCIVIVFAAFINAAGMIDPVMMWEHGWHARLGSMALAVSLFQISALAAACAGVALCYLCDREAGRRLLFALVPLGITMWAAHLMFHFITGANAAWPTIQRAWSGVASPAVPLLPDWLPQLQIVLLDLGLLVTLYVCWKVSKRVLTVLPWAVLSCGLYAVGIWILLQPMQMRGMAH